MAGRERAIMGQRWYSGATRGHWMALLAALLGWMFDGFEMGVFPLVARPALVQLRAARGPPGGAALHRRVGDGRRVGARGGPGDGDLAGARPAGAGGADRRRRQPRLPLHGRPGPGPVRGPGPETRRLVAADPAL